MQPRDVGVPPIDAPVRLDGAVDVAFLDVREAAVDAPLIQCPSSCPSLSACNLATGECLCDAGYRMINGSCAEEALTPADLATRTPEEVCRQWRNGRRMSSLSAWSAEPGNVCASGTVNMAARRDMLSTLNVYRWLSGLALVPEDGARSTNDQSCALLMYRNVMASNSPPANWTCYSQAAATAAQTANVIFGASSPRAAVDDWIADTGAAVVVNRRWFLNARLSSVGIGIAGETSFGACVGVQSTSATPARTWSAWPAPGPMPLEAAPMRWSVHSHSNTITFGQATVTVTRNGQPVPTTSQLASQPGGPPDSVVFAPSVAPQLGDVYVVTFQGIAGGAPTTLSYTTTFVSC